MTRENKRKEQCRWCISVIEQCRMARHVCGRHPEHVEDWIHDRQGEEE